MTGEIDDLQQDGCRRSGIERARLARLGDRREHRVPVAAWQRPADLLERFTWGGRGGSFELENLRRAGAKRARGIRQERGQPFFVLAVQRVAARSRMMRFIRTCRSRAMAIARGTDSDSKGSLPQRRAGGAGCQRI